MAVTLDATVGGVASNSYETVADAQLYFDTRTEVLGWENGDQDILLMMGTRVLDAMARARRVYVSGSRNTYKSEAPYFITRRTWTGAPATTTQKLAWPRTGMYDANGNVLNWSISAISVAAAAVVTTSVPHGRTTGETVLIFGSDSTPSIDGARVVTVLSTTTFSVPVTTSVVGTTGGVTIIPQDLKDALAELAGHLGNTDSTVDNDVTVQGLTSIKAGSVALTFKDMIERHVLPDMVFDLMPPSWFTDEVITPAWPALFDVVSE